MSKPPRSRLAIGAPPPEGMRPYLAAIWSALDEVSDERKRGQARGWLVIAECGLKDKREDHEELIKLRAKVQAYELALNTFNNGRSATPA